MFHRGNRVKVEKFILKDGAQKPDDTEEPIVGSLKCTLYLNGFIAVGSDIDPNKGVITTRVKCMEVLGEREAMIHTQNSRYKLTLLIDGESL